LSLLLQAFAAAATGLGLLALLGWISGHTLLASFGGSLMPMAPGAALLFVLLGVSLYFRSRFPSSRWTYLMGMALGSFAALAAILLLALPAATIDNSIEHLGMSISGTFHGVPLGQMSPLTALSCAFIALSFLGTLSSSPDRRGRVVAAFALTCILTLVSTALLLGYLLGIPLLSGGDFVPPTLPSSLCSLFLALAVLTRAGLQVWPSEATGVPKAPRPSYAAALIFVLLSSGILVVGYVYHRNFERQYRAEIENVLASITDLKVSELTHWRQERLAGAAQFYRNTTFSGLAERFLRIPEDVDARPSILAWFQQVREADLYDRISLYDASLVERLSSPNGLEPADSLFLRHAAFAMRSHEVVFQDFYRDEHIDRVFLNILIPIVSARNSNRIIGMIAMRIDPDKYIYPLLKRWPTPSRTAETLLIRKEGNDALFLNQLRFNNDAALKLRIPLDSTDVPAVKAALGVSGIVEGRDYRGVAVIADVHTVPDSPWFLVARIDISEVYAPLHERSRITILLMCVMFIGAASGLALLWRRQNVRFYKDQYLAERERTWLHDVIARSINEIYVIDPQTLRFKFANAGAQRNIGYSAGELTELTPVDIAPEYTEKTFRAMLRPLFTGEKGLLVIKALHRRKDGSRYPVESHLQLVERPEGKVCLAIVTDITERERAESELRRYVNQLSVINRLDHVISSTFDIGEVYDTLVLDMRQLFQFDRTSLSTLNEERTEWQIVKQWTSGEPGLMPKVWRKVEGSVVEWLILNKRSFVEERIGEQGTWAEDELLTKEGIASRVAVPLIVRGKVIGAMTLASKNPEAYKKGDVEMLESLADQVGISMHNAMMYNKVGEHAATLEKRVKERTGQLETANKELEAFSYSVSHDLRAPLRSIDGFSKIMMEEYSNKIDAEGKRILNVIRANTQKMGELITDLLDLSRVTRDEMKTVRVDMTTLASSVFREIASPDVQKQYAFSIEALPDAYGDPSLLRQVWRNLISNAIKFTATKDVRHIEIGTRSEDGMTVYFIRDSGVGFDPQYTHKLFGVFQRLHSTEEFEGTGVGLAIVQRIVHRHGGRVWAEGRIGEGATFSFSLPSKENNRG
jgi:PAS domain S-box-containing protein